MAQTKEQILSYLSGLDVSVLQKLQDYAEYIIIPEEDLLVNATMSQMVDKAHTLADSLFPEWTDRSKSDFGEFLVELFALFSEKDFWYINAFANENILRKMRSYSNAYIKVSSMGYTPTLCRGASADFSVTFEAGSSVTYRRGDLVVRAGDLYFTNDENFTVESAGDPVTKTLTLREGRWLSDDPAFNGYKVFLRKQNVDIDSVSVAIGNIAFSKVNNFGFSGASSNHFVVLPEDDGSCSVFFGSDGLGVTPALGTLIHVEYRQCNGAAGNIPISGATPTDYHTNRAATAAEMLSVATGGSDAESLTSLKEKAPVFFSTQQAVINDKIAKQVLESFPFVKRAATSTLGRVVSYSVIPTSGDANPSAEEQAYLFENFVPYLMVGYSGNYAPNTYKDIIATANPSATQMIVEVIMSPGYNAASVEASIRQVMQDITNPLVRADYGDTFSKATTDMLLRTTISGLQSTTFKLKVGSTEPIMPDFTLGKMEIFQPIDNTKLVVRITSY